MTNQDGRHITLTSSELGELWKNYIGESLLNCVYTHYLSNVDDERIKAILEKASNMTKSHMMKLEKLFNKESFAIPAGFGKNDVNDQAQAVFTDKFYLFYLKEASRINLLQFSNALTVSFRADVREYFSECVKDMNDLYQETMDAMLAKGLIIRSPFIPVPTEVKFIESKDFLHKLIGKQRPMTSTEITSMYVNLDSNQLGKSLMMAFSQVVQSEDIKKYILRGRDISHKNIVILQDFLTKDHLPAPQLWDPEVLESKVAPFSEKLMLYHVALANAGSLFNYGIGLTSTFRYDISVDVARLVTEIAKFSNDGVKLLIERNWLEQPPMAADRDELAK
ncbi:DUF3231 family protein [Alkalihalobacillus macyae]|uniref:DUF3231 family protein n=1 Tax=Guptibacillus hwajinpoensis TaxID=208199 RepID=UPI00273C7252|nr:DUF3231 family protein [Alkalihalobacillus macyae]MDP4552155.1 DUF3231 family protein [Alkalihalobacillus macyae]